MTLMHDVDFAMLNLMHQREQALLRHIAEHERRTNELLRRMTFHHPHHAPAGHPIRRRFI